MAKAKTTTSKARSTAKRTTTAARRKTAKAKTGKAKAAGRRRKRPATPPVLLMHRPGKRRRPLSADDRDLAWALDRVARSGLELSRMAGRSARRTAMSGRYDSAQTAADNARHWSMADGLSANAAASHAVRQILRNRARYEVANNSYARGIVNTLANDTVGTGPRLRVDTRNKGLNRLIERAFQAWAAEIGLPDKLRLMRVARVQDGEAFAALTTNEGLRGDVKLDLTVFEADQVSSPDGSTTADNIDGVLLDAWGNPRAYQVLAAHPGAMGATREAAALPAESMLHWFRADRPGQHRGLPELVSSLALFAQLRRYTLAVADAAEAAADFALVLYTDHPADDECDYVKPLDEFDIERGMMTTMPEGWKPAQIKGEQPTTTYEIFVRAVLREIARCLGMPYCIAAGDSSGYNFASGRLDHKTYFKAIRIDQEHLERVVLNRLLGVWLREAALASVIPAAFYAGGGQVPHEWFWDGDKYSDPLKEAVATTESLANGSTHIAEVYAEFGQNWEVEMTRAAEALGVTLQEYQALLRQKLFGSASAESGERARKLADEEEPPAEPPAEGPSPARRGRAREREGVEV